MKRKRCLILFGAAVFMAMQMAGCGGSGEPSGAAGTSENTVESGQEEAAAKAEEPKQREPSDAGNEEPVKIKIFNRVNAEVSVENNPILAVLEEKLNVEIEYEAPPINNYNEKLQITMASGELPDIIYNWGGADINYEQWAKDGLLAELDDVIGNYPNIMETINEDYWDEVRSINTGKIHSVPRTNVDNYWGFIINEDWLDALGLEHPDTLEELREVFRQFTYNDPDGNGKDDTYGFSFETTASSTLDVQPLKFAFDLENVPDSDGNYTIREKKEGYIPYLNFLRDLYEDGSLDPEFITNSKEAVKEKFTGGKVGTVVDHQVGLFTYMTTVPDAYEKYSYIAAPEQEDGSRAEYVTLSMWGTWMISADADVEKCLEILDYGMSEEGFVLMTLGIEGEHYDSYDYEARMVTRSEEQATDLTSITSSYFTFAYAKEGSSAIIENATTEETIEKYYLDLNQMKDLAEEVRVPSIKAPLFTTFGADHPDLITSLAELEIQFVVGEIGEEELRAFLEEEYYLQADEMEAELNEWMKER